MDLILFTMAARDDTPSATVPGLTGPDFSGECFRQASTARVATLSCMAQCREFQSRDANMDLATELCKVLGLLRSHSDRICMSASSGYHILIGSSLTKYKLRCVNSILVFDQINF